MTSSNNQSQGEAIAYFRLLHVLHSGLCLVLPTRATQQRQKRSSRRFCDDR